MTQNNLGAETSPYLLQHKDNPVHWQAWGPAALAAAKDGGKTVPDGFLYSSDVNDEWLDAAGLKTMLEA